MNLRLNTLIRIPSDSRIQALQRLLWVVHVLLIRLCKLHHHIRRPPEVALLRVELDSLVQTPHRIRRRRFAVRLERILHHLGRLERVVEVRAVHQRRALERLARLLEIADCAVYAACGVLRVSIASLLYILWLA